MGDGGAGGADTQKPFYFKQTKCMPAPGSQISRAACSGAMNPPNLTGEVGLLSPAFAKYRLEQVQGFLQGELGSWMGWKGPAGAGSGSQHASSDGTEWIYLAS